MGLHGIPREFHGTPQEIPRDSERLHESPKYFISVATLVKNYIKSCIQLDLETSTQFTLKQLFDIDLKTFPVNMLEIRFLT